MKHIILFSILLLVVTQAQCEPLKIATWNMEWLADNLNSGHKQRSADDYKAISKYARLLDADIIAVQEVEGKKALRRVFDEAGYNFILSSRNSQQRTGFVIRKGIKYRRDNDLTELNTSGGLRHGVIITVTSSDTNQTLRLLSVHMKSGCFSDNYLSSSRNACKKFALQVPILEQWIDEQANHQQPFIVLGDFNRRITADEQLWIELDDKNPANADLTLHTAWKKPACYNGKYKKFIDHLISDKLAVEYAVSGSFNELVYSSEDMQHYQLPDHCPVGISINL